MMTRGGSGGAERRPDQLGRGVRSFDAHHSHPRRVLAGEIQDVTLPIIGVEIVQQQDTPLTAPYSEVFEKVLREQQDLHVSVSRYPIPIESAGRALEDDITLERVTFFVAPNPTYGSPIATLVELNNLYYTVGRTLRDSEIAPPADANEGEQVPFSDGKSRGYITLPSLSYKHKFGQVNYTIHGETASENLSLLNEKRAKSGKSDSEVNLPVGVSREIQDIRVVVCPTAALAEILSSIAAVNNSDFWRAFPIEQIQQTEGLLEERITSMNTSRALATRRSSQESWNNFVDALTDLLDHVTDGLRRGLRTDNRNEDF